MLYKKQGNWAFSYSICIIFAASLPNLPDDLHSPVFESITLIKSQLSPYFPVVSFKTIINHMPELLSVQKNSSENDKSSLISHPLFPQRPRAAVK